MQILIIIRTYCGPSDCNVGHYNLKLVPTTKLKCFIFFNVNRLSQLESAPAHVALC